MPSIHSWGITDGLCLARTAGRYLPDPSRFTASEFIEAAERAAKENPAEWVIFYQLGDKYQSVGQYARALQAGKRCVELKPNDIRSAYALATAYNVLTRAEWVNLDAQITLLASVLAADLAEVLNPSLSKTELEEMGMLVDTAAAQAIRWFENALKLDPDEASAVQIAQDLAPLYERFPHLRF